MADGAIRQATGRVDLVLPNEMGAFLLLIGRRSPIQVVNLGRLGSLNQVDGGAKICEIVFNEFQVRVLIDS